MNHRRAKLGRSRARGAVLGFSLIVPLLMGGCPTFRNEVVGVANAATQGLVLGNLSEAEAVDSVSRGVLSALIDLAFDSLLDDRASGSTFR